MIENHYRNVFKEIYLWSPTSRLDAGWSSTFEYMRKHLKQDPDATDKENQCVFDTFKGDDLDYVVEKQTKTIKELKARKSNKSVELPNILLIRDHFGGQQEVMRRPGFVTCASSGSSGRVQSWHACCAVWVRMRSAPQASRRRGSMARGRWRRRPIIAVRTG